MGLGIYESPRTTENREVALYGCTSPTRDYCFWLSRVSRQKHPFPSFSLIGLYCISNVLTFLAAAQKSSFQLAFIRELMGQAVNSPLGPLNSCVGISHCLWDSGRSWHNLIYWEPLGAKKVAWSITEVWKATRSSGGLTDEVHLLHDAVCQDWERWLFYLMHRNKCRESRKRKKQEGIFQTEEQGKYPETDRMASQLNSTEHVTKN